MHNAAPGDECEKGGREERDKHMTKLKSKSSNKTERLTITRNGKVKEKRTKCKYVYKGKLRNGGIERIQVGGCMQTYG